MNRHIRWAAVLAAALVATLAVVATAAAHRQAGVKKITVTMTDFKFALSAKSVPKGTVEFDVVNKGNVAHNFQIKGKVTPIMVAGKKAKLIVKFTKAGSFPYVCTVPGHAALGMRGTFKVK
jgi:plastocyanin